MKVAVVSAIYGDFDTPKQVKDQSVETEWVLVTDVDRDVPGWRVKVHKQPYDPRTAAKIPKLFPWLYADADVYIWLDGSFQVTSETFVEEATANVQRFAQFVHPDRNCLFDEAAVSLGIAKYSQGDIRGQTATYREAGMPSGWGLWATGLIVRKRCDVVEQHSNGWWDQILKWSYQDQVSEPFVCWALDLRPEPLPHALWSNPWVTWMGHARGD